MRSWKLLVVGIVFAMLKACGGGPSVQISPMTNSKELIIPLSEIELASTSDDFIASWEERKVSEGITEFVLKLEAEKAVVPEKMNMHWSNGAWMASNLISWDGLQPQKAPI